MNSPRILVVDDSDDVRELNALLLEQAGYTVDSADSGEQAFAKIREHRPELVLLDIIMPGMDGLEVLLKLRSDLAPPLPPVILCSGFDLTEAEALNRGAARFLRKPVMAGDLVDAVAAVLAHQQISPERLALERRNTNQARRGAREAAGRLMQSIEEAASERTLEEIAGEHLETFSHYLAIGSGAIAILRGDQMVVLAASKESVLSVGADLGRSLPEAFEVLETRSCLVLPDASARPFASVSRALGGVRFFVGVPLIAAEDIPVGVLTFFKVDPFQLEAEDLSIIQLIGRRAGALLSFLAYPEPGIRPGHYGPGLVFRRMFEPMLQAELSLLARHGGSLTLAVVDVDDPGQVPAAIRGSVDRGRLLAGLMGDHRVAIYKRTSDNSSLRQITTLLKELPGANTGAGTVELVGVALDAFSASELLRAAEAACDRAIENHGPMSCVHIQSHDYL